LAINYDDFRKEDGFIDWAALHAWERAHGERCMRCGRGILFPRASSGPALCPDCRELDTRVDEVEHPSLIRCPNCEKQMRVFGDYDIDTDLLYEGEHDVSCDECGHDFVVSTRVEYFFTSPKLGVEKEEEGAHET